MPELTIDEIIGDPKRLDADLQAFRNNTRVLSSNKANLIAKYSKNWIAIHNGKVGTHARTLKQILAALDALAISRDEVVVRYIDRNVHRMIL